MWTRLITIVHSAFVLTIMSTLVFRHCLGGMKEEARRDGKRSGSKSAKWVKIKPHACATRWPNEAASLHRGDVCFVAFAISQKIDHITT